MSKFGRKNSEPFVDGMNFGDSRIIRLVYASFSETCSDYTPGFKIGQSYFISDNFNLPDGMSIQEACKVVSYLSEKVERENNLQPGCQQSVVEVGDILPQYGFKVVSSSGGGYFLHIDGHMYIDKGYGKCVRPCGNVYRRPDGVVELITYAGKELFEQSNLYSLYFEWFTEGVSKDEFDKIIQKSRNLASEDTSQC